MKKVLVFSLLMGNLAVATGQLEELDLHKQLEESRKQTAKYKAAIEFRKQFPKIAITKENLKPFYDIELEKIKKESLERMAQAQKEYNKQLAKLKKQLGSEAKALDAFKQSINQEFANIEKDKQAFKKEILPEKHEPLKLVDGQPNNKLVKTFYNKYIDLKKQIESAQSNDVHNFNYNDGTINVTYTLQNINGKFSSNFSAKDANIEILEENGKLVERPIKSGRWQGIKNTLGIGS